MKWVTTDYKGNKKVWYSEDVINRIREWATGGIISKALKAEKEFDACDTIINFLNEVDE